MFDDIFSDLYSNQDNPWGAFGGDEGSVGITQQMGMPGGSYGDYGGGNVFDGGFPASSDVFNPALTQMYGGGYQQPDLSWADGGGGGGWSSLLNGLGGARGIGQLLGSGLSVGSGINALSQARRLQDQAAQADPMAPYRAGWAGQLNGLLANPGSITSEPGYGAALEAVKRGGAAAGFFGSGNMVGDLAQFGVDFYDRAVNRLGRLVGGTPGGGLQGTQSSINLTNAGLNRIGSGIASLSTGLFDGK